MLSQEFFKSSIHAALDMVTRARHSKHLDEDEIVGQGVVEVRSGSPQYGYTTTDRFHLIGCVRPEIPQNDPAMQ